MAHVAHATHVGHAGRSEASSMESQQQQLQQLRQQEQTAQQQVRSAESSRAKSEQAASQAQQQVTRSAVHFKCIDCIIPFLVCIIHCGHAPHVLVCPWAGQGRAGQGRAGQGRAGQGIAGQPQASTPQTWQADTLQLPKFRQRTARRFTKCPAQICIASGSSHNCFSPAQYAVHGCAPQHSMPWVQGSGQACSPTANNS